MARLRWRWRRIWIAVLAAIGVLDLLAQLSDGPTPRTLSEQLVAWFKAKWKRLLLVGLLALLAWHLWSLPDQAAPPPGTSLPMSGDCATDGW